MKKILYITTSIVIVFLFCFIGAKKTSAVTDCRPGGTCTIGLGESGNLILEAFDEDDIKIEGSPVTYTWTVPADLGSFQNNSTTWVDTNSTGTSTAVLSIPKGGNIQVGNVSVVADYGGYNVPATFEIAAICNRDPLLYFGIGGVKDSGESNWHYSTAEVMETCFNEYKLYGGKASIY